VRFRNISTIYRAKVIVKRAEFPRMLPGFPRTSLVGNPMNKGNSPHLDNFVAKGQDQSKYSEPRGEDPEET
jgi:hypothetical protein